MSSFSCTVLIVAAGQGVRAPPGGLPKQYRALAGRPVLQRALDAFIAHPAVDSALVVIGAGDRGNYDRFVAPDERILEPVVGGATRQESVRLGLAALGKKRPDRVLIHDGVRPFASAELISRVVASLGDNAAVLPTLALTDTVKAVDRMGRVKATVPREGLHTAATPQGFRFDEILDAHEKAASAGVAFTDDAAIAEWAGIPVHTVAGEAGNIKLTTGADFDIAEKRLMAEYASRCPDVRVGTGYDVHAFGPGVVVALGGVSIPHTRGVVGHSDGDVVLHALTDAILGALAEGDIGDHFPPTDPQWKGAASERFVRFAAERVAARGGVIAHVDVAIIAEAPRIADRRAEMRQRIAQICGITADRVGIKATTNENLGFIGRGEGVAALATATIRLPFAPP